MYWNIHIMVMLLISLFFLLLSIQANALYPATAFQYPLQDYVETSYYFGQLVGDKFHAGQDCKGNGGTPVYAVADGIISYSGEMGGYGWLITIDHQLPSGSWVYSLYGHISTRRWKKTSGEVRRGELIGYLADDDEDGGEWGPHLHFAIRNSRKSDYPNSGPNRWMAGYTPEYPTNYGWMDPTEFVDSHCTIPLAGDWDGDGDDDIGGYYPANSTFYLYIVDLNTSTASSYADVPLGQTGDIPISGDWDSDGDDDIGIFRVKDPNPNTNNFYFDIDLTGGQAEYNVTDFGLNGYGNIGDIPVIGDWDRDGDDNIGVYRPSNSQFYTRTDVPDIHEFIKSMPWLHLLLGE